jgi:hypothetical protein
VEKLAESLGVTKLSKSQVSVMAAELDEMVTQFRSRPLDAGPYTFLRIDALTQKVREGGRTVNVHALIATGVNAGGKREILGLDVATAEDGSTKEQPGACGTPRHPVRQPGHRHTQIVKSGTVQRSSRCPGPAIRPRESSGLGSRRSSPTRPPRQKAPAQTQPG